MFKNNKVIPIEKPIKKCFKCNGKSFTPFVNNISFCKNCKSQVLFDEKYKIDSFDNFIKKNNTSFI